MAVIAFGFTKVKLPLGKLVIKICDANFAKSTFNFLEIMNHWRFLICIQMKVNSVGLVGSGSSPLPIFIDPLLIIHKSIIIYI